MDILEGKVWKFGDNIDTDVIIPGRYLRTFNPKELASHVMAGERIDFSSNVNDGDIILGGWNFGCGSSREQAPIAIKYSGVSVVIAKSFARIFYRNAINIGLPVVVADVDADEEDILRVDLEKGNIVNLTNNETFQTTPFKNFMLNILQDGGLVNHYLKKNK